MQHTVKLPVMKNSKALHEEGELCIHANSFTELIASMKRKHESFKLKVQSKKVAKHSQSL